MQAPTRAFYQIVTGALKVRRGPAPFLDERTHPQPLNGEERQMAGVLTHSSPLSPSPTVPFVPLRFSSCLPPKLCVWQERNCVSFQPTATVCEYPPIVLFAPAPSCDEKPLILLGSLGLTCGILPYRSKTRCQKLLV